MGAFGLQTHIWNNNFKSVLLLAGFPLLLLLLLYAINVGMLGAAGLSVPIGSALTLAAERTLAQTPFAVLGAGLWFLIAFFAHDKIIAASVKGKSLSRQDAPELYNMLENLCVSRGLAMPRLQIVETPALNAFASGIRDEHYTVTVTRGLLNQLADDEVEAVLAHELTHIRNKDVRLLIISVIFVGIFSFVGELLFRSLFRTGVRMGGHTRSRNGDSRGGGALILIAIALIAVAYLLAIVLRFGLSRRREYLADAGAVDLTKNPDAMIRALQKISGRAQIEGVSVDVHQMMIENDKPFAGLFATHPSIDSRIEALVNFAGGQNSQTP